MGYSPWGCKASDKTEQLSTAHLHSYALKERKIYDKDLLKYSLSGQPQQNQTENYYSKSVASLYN